MDDTTTEQHDGDSFEWAVYEVGLMNVNVSSVSAFHVTHTRVAFAFRNGEDFGDAVLRATLRRARAALETYAENANRPAVDALRDILSMFRRKQADYSPSKLDNGRWQNFIDMGKHIDNTAGAAVEMLIELKTSRLPALMLAGTDPTNESILDTYLDRAVYCLIAVAMLKDGMY